MDAQIITRHTLEDAGIDLSGEDVVALLAYVNELVEERISTKITDSLSEKQIEAMLEQQASTNDAKLAAWMKQNVPNMDTLVQREVDQLLDEIIEADEN